MKINPFIPEITLRDLAAMEFMATFLTGARLPPGFDATEQMDFIATRAYEAADALLKSRQS